MSGEESKTLKSPALVIDLQGQAEHIVYRNAENGYTVLRLRVRGYPDLVTAVGVMAEPAAGEMLSMKGHWTENSRYGMQFHFDSCESSLPSTAGGLEKFLGSGLIRGIGPATARKIVEKFGDETARILDEEPMRLAEVKGVSSAKAEAAGQSWREQREMREVMVFLQGYGVGAGYAMRIFRKYGSAALEVMKANPYQIALDVQGIGFATADAIAQKLGVPHDSPYRVAAGVHNALNDLTGEGHVYVPRKMLAALAAEKLGVAEEIAAAGIEQARLAGNIVVEEIPGSGEDESAVYLPAYHYAETHSAENLRRIAEEPYNSKAVDTNAAIPWLEREMEMTFAEAQREAITRAVNSKVMVITGGPGTGKTTLLRAFLRLREEGGYRVMLAAPTGRAAKRMTEATGHEAKTIHRLLEYSSGGGFADDAAGRANSLFGGGFMRNEENKLECDLLIVDEASMVSPGNVLKDIIDSGVCPVVMLNEIFRQSGASRIITNAHRVNRGELPLEPEDGALSDFYFIEPKVASDGLTDEEYKRRFDDKVLATIKKLVTENIPRRFGFDPVNDIQVLCPMHSGVAGTRRLNAELEKLLNAGNGARVQRLDRVFKAGDKVMQIKNNYDKDVYNGDIGTIVSIDGENSRLYAKMDAGIVDYDFTELDELVHAYAVSIHKSQGSEYPAVVIPLLTQHYVMLQRNLLYTAITRGKKLVVIVGTKKALRIAVANDKTKKRYTRLAERLRGEK